MNKLVASLSIIGLLAISNISSAAESDLTRVSAYAGQIPAKLNFTAPASGGEDDSINIKFGGFGIAEKEMPEEDQQQN